MTSVDLFLIFAGGLAAITFAVAVGPPISNAIRRWLHPIPHALIIELSERARRGEPIDRADVSKIMGQLTVADYTSLPAERQGDIQRILDAASRIVPVKREAGSQGVPPPVAGGGGSSVAQSIRVDRPMPSNAGRSQGSISAVENSTQSELTVHADLGIYTPSEEALTAMWAELLNVPEPRLTDNFFELGGDSLVLLRFLARVHENFGVRISMHQFYEDPTIAAIAEFVDAQMMNSAASSKDTAIDQAPDTNESIDSLHRTASDLYLSGIEAYVRRDYDDAESRYREALAVYEQLADEHGQAIGLHQLGTVAQERRDLDQAERYYRQSLALAERQGDERGQMTTLFQLGLVAEERGNREEALDRFSEAQTIIRRLSPGDQSRAIGVVQRIRESLREKLSNPD